MKLGRATLPAFALLASFTALSAGIDLAPCRVEGLREEVLCGSHRVFENRKSGKGRTIDLRIVVLPARESDSSADPVLFLHGGPGGAATHVAPVFAHSGLRDRRDVVLVDQRGTGGSNPLNCEAGSVQVQLETMSTFDYPHLQACRDAQNADLRHYTTSLAVEDLEDVRRAMDLGPVNLLGGSYGTRVALEYIRRYPESVRTAVLRGVAPPSFEIAARFGRDSQNALDRVLDDCAAEARCRKAFPRLRHELGVVLRRLEQTSAHVSVRDPGEGRRTEVQVTRDIFAGLVHYALYLSPTASRLPAGIHSAYEGNLVPLVEQALLFQAMIASQLSDGAFFSAVCTEDIPFLDRSEIAASRGTLLGTKMAANLERACESWPHDPAPAAFKQPVRSDVPVLLISGEADPVTPPEIGEQTARHLSDSLHVVLPETGHSDWAPGCVDDLIERFIERGTTRGLDAGCVGTIRRPAFALD